MKQVRLLLLFKASHEMVTLPSDNLIVVWLHKGSVLCELLVYVHLEQYTKCMYIVCTKKITRSQGTY